MKDGEKKSCAAAVTDPAAGPSFSTANVDRASQHFKTSGVSTRAIQAAEGWADLGLFDEAASELEKVPARFRFTTAGLKVWARIHCARGAWGEVEVICGKLLANRPRDHEVRMQAAEALHRMGRSQEAVFMFAEALQSPRIKEDATARYSLARYFCGAGNVSEAREVLRSAILRDGSLRGKALTDPDFEKIWIHFQGGFDK